MDASPSRKVFASQDNVSTSDQLMLSVEEDGPPKPPRSAFMCFTDAKKKELLIANSSAKKQDILKTVAAEWSKLTDRDRAFWDEEARNDKVRFVREKAEYKGPWNIPKRRAKKHPLAPKRPCSAFLSYSKNRRAHVKESNPNMSNTDVSRLLGEMWRTASPPEKKRFVEQELIERAKYKDEIKKFRESLAKTDAVSRKSHQDVQQGAGADMSRAKLKETPRRHFHARAGVYHGASSSVVFPSHSGPPLTTSSFVAGDRRVFRPYSGGQNFESARFYGVEQQRIHPSYEHNEVIPPPPPPIKMERPMFRTPRPSPTESRPNGAASDNKRVEGSVIHRHPHQSNPHQPFRPTFHPPENHNVPQIRYASSDISQFEGFNIDGNLNESFADSDPPFNPRQQRPAASHYFSESFYKYS